MKPMALADTEMVFLRDIERRLLDLQRVQESHWAIGPAILGLQSVVQCRIAEVTKLRDDNKGENNAYKKA